MVSFNEIHFAGTASQSSIYGLTSLFTGYNSHKVLMASSKRKVYCIEYSETQRVLIPSTREVQFTYIPGGAEIISIDSFNQTSHRKDFVIGITFIKSDNGGKQSQYFNIYSDRESSSECDLDNIAQGCFSISLDFIPFHLTHAILPSVKDVKEVVWLLSGSDSKIHLYREDKLCHTYCEEPSEVLFPEFEELPAVVLWIDFMVSETSRYTALGCKDGHVIFSVVNLTQEAYIQSSWKIQHDGPISALKIFQDMSAVPIGLKCQDDTKNQSSHPVHLFVGNTLEVSVVYRNILTKGLCLSSQWFLPESSKFDCVTCGLVSDVNMDGFNELTLGTYGQELLIYKWESELNSNKGSYVLYHQQSFPNPLLALSYTDVTGDGLKELLVLSTKGLHIMQHDLKEIVKLCMERLKFLQIPQNTLENILQERLKNKI